MKEKEVPNFLALSSDLKIVSLIGNMEKHPVVEKEYNKNIFPKPKEEKIAAKS